MANNEDTSNYPEIVRRILAQGPKDARSFMKPINGTASLPNKSSHSGAVEPETPEDRQLAARFKRERSFRTGSDGMDDSIGM